MFDNKVVNELLGDTDAGGASADEKDALLQGIDTGKFNGTYETREDDGAGTLDIIVEAQDFVAPQVEEAKGVVSGEVLKPTNMGQALWRLSMTFWQAS